MAKFRTLDLHLTNLKVTRLGPGRYQNEISCVDWDDGVKVSFKTITLYPFIAVSIFKIRAQVEDLIESEPPED
ncbi:MAG: hypothetical protein E3J81_08405 [Dehalococcoidia bacterium]|nr:MAG: hypothetical protein E3J81_08405 [Dehalococcoidia bacterium]